MKSVPQELLDEVIFHAQLALRIGKMCSTRDHRNGEFNYELARGHERANHLHSEIMATARSMGLIEFNCECQSNLPKLTALFLPEEFGLVAECVCCGKRFIFSRHTRKPVEAPRSNFIGALRFVDDNSTIKEMIGEFLVSDNCFHRVLLTTKDGLEKWHGPVPYDTWQMLKTQTCANAAWRKYTNDLN